MRRSTLLPLLLLALAAGCGGGNDQSSPPGTSPTNTDVFTVTQPEDTARPGEEPTGDPQFTVTLTGQNATPTAGQRWRYTVRATSEQGDAASGTAKMRVFVDGELVDTLGFFLFTGELMKTHVWPRSLRGESVELQAEVEGDGGTQRAVLPLSVR